MERITPLAYSRALRALAVVVATISLSRQLAGGFPTPATERQVLWLRIAASVVAVGIALLSSPRRSVTELRRLALLLGIDSVVLTLGVAILLPRIVWEQTLGLVALVLGAAVFMPWSWRWQAAFATIAVVGITVTVAFAIPVAVLAPPAAARLLITVYVVSGASVLGADLSDRLRRQIDAAQADRRAEDRQRLHEQRLDALARFAGGIAHQFNNLLGGILTHAEVLRQDAATSAVAAELDEIAAAARRGRDLTGELLRFTRSDPVQLRPTDPAQVLGSVAELARAILGEMATVEVLAPPLPPIAADPDYLAHACTQIVLNARDAMRGRTGARLTLSAAEETLAARAPAWPDADPGRYVRISLSDTGRGMDQATLERVFEPFFTTKPLHEAKGLGLATVHRVMREHAGAARVESEPGRGTTVHLLLPLATEPLPVTAPPRSALPAPAASGATILVVDDEPIVRNSLKRALQRFGHRVLEAGDGGAALAAMQSANPPVDLVILDLVLPGGGAGIFELLKAVRPEVKVLVSSGYSPDAVAAQGLATRVEGFLPKPYELAQLREMVSRLLAGGG